MFDKVSMLIVIVSDMKRSVEFYRDTLGLPLKFESPGWSEFATPGTTLALHPETEQKKVNPGGISFGFNTGNLDEAYETLKARGVRFIMPPTQQDFGFRLAVFLDPDGYPIPVSDYH